MKRNTDYHFRTFVTKWTTKKSLSWNVAKTWLDADVETLNKILSAFS